MMRTIKFRGQQLSNRDWIVGDLIHLVDGVYISNDNGNNMAQVNPDTVCQFTDLTDKNGKEIYEGDVIHIGSDHGVVVWRDSLCCFSLKISYEKLPGTTPLGEMLHLYDHEVVGNIHEPEWKHHGNYPQRLRRKGKIN